MKREWGRPLLVEIIRFLLIALAVLSIFAFATFSGIFVGEEWHKYWEGRQKVVVNDSVEDVIVHIQFNEFQPDSCEEGILVTLENVEIPFKIINGTYENGKCVEAYITFKNIIYQSKSSSEIKKENLSEKPTEEIAQENEEEIIRSGGVTGRIISEFTREATYFIYYGKKPVSQQGVIFEAPTPEGELYNQDWIFVNVSLVKESEAVLLNFNDKNYSMEGNGNNFYINLTDLSEGDYYFYVLSKINNESYFTGPMRHVKLIKVTENEEVKNISEETNISEKNVPLNLSNEVPSESKKMKVLEKLENEEICYDSYQEDDGALVIEAGKICVPYSKVNKADGIKKVDGKKIMHEFKKMNASFGRLNEGIEINDKDGNIISFRPKINDSIIPVKKSVNNLEYDDGNLSFNYILEAID